MHDCFTLELEGRTGNAGNILKGLYDHMCLRQALAHRPLLLPDKGKRIQAQHVHAQVRNEQHFPAHRKKDFGVRIVQVPLE